MTRSLFLISILLAAAIPPEQHLAEGRRQLAQHDYSSAVEELSAAAAADDPELRAEALLQRGMAYLLGTGETEKALVDFLASAALARQPATARLWASTAAEKLGLQSEAERLEALALSPPEAAAPEPARGAGEEPPGEPTGPVDSYFQGTAATDPPPPPAEPPPPQVVTDPAGAFQGEASDPPVESYFQGVGPTAAPAAQPRPAADRTGEKGAPVADPAPDPKDAEVSSPPAETDPVEAFFRGREKQKEEEAKQGDEPEERED